MLPLMHGWEKFLALLSVFVPGQAFLSHDLGSFNRQMSLFKGSNDFSQSSDSWRQYDPAYLKALQEAARDPKRFEEFISKSSDLTAKDHLNPDKSTGIVKAHNSSEPCVVQEKKRGYVPIEQWDKEQKELLKEMSWEQRVQFDGQRNGDQFRQNEILRKNLKIF
jgi:hypothetical protein